MTSIWERLDVEGKVIEVLASVRPAPSPDLGGRPPFLSVYQLAILIDDRYPEIRQTLKNEPPIGGADIGSRSSLAQYLAHQLAVHIRRNGDDYPIEGATLSRTYLGDMWFKPPRGQNFRNSNADAGWDLFLLRLR